MISNKMKSQFQKNINILNKKNENILFNIETINSNMLTYILDIMDENIINEKNNKGESFIINLKKFINSTSVENKDILNILKEHPKVNFKLIEKDIIENISIWNYSHLIKDKTITINDNNFNELIKYNNSKFLYHGFYQNDLIDFFNKNANSSFTNFLNEHFFNTNNIYNYPDAFKRGYNLLTLNTKEKLYLLNKNMPRYDVSLEVADFIIKINKKYNSEQLFIDNNMIISKNLGINKEVFHKIIQSFPTELIKKNEKKLFNFFFQNTCFFNAILTEIINRDINYFKNFFSQSNNYNKYINLIYKQEKITDINTNTFRLLLNLKNPFEEIISLKENNNFLKTNILSKCKNFDKMFEDYIFQNSNEDNYKHLKKITNNNKKIINYIQKIDKNKINEIKYGLTLCDFLIIKMELYLNKEYKYTSSYLYNQEKIESVIESHNNAFVTLIKKGYIFNKNEVDQIKKYKNISMAIKGLVEKNFIKNIVNKKINKNIEKNSKKFLLNQFNNI